MNTEKMIAGLFPSLGLPAELWDRIILVFHENYPTTYKFARPIEHWLFKGFYFIPGFSRYLISRDGRLRSGISGNELAWTKTLPVPAKRITGGYMSTNLVNDEGNRKGALRHRLLLMTFSDYDFHPSERWVNHKNGIPGDDRLDNLEWATPSKNVKHAYDSGLHSEKVTPVDAWNWRTDEKHEFATVQAAVEALNLTYTLITHRLRTSNQKRYQDGWRFKYRDDEWLELDTHARKSVQNTTVLIYNVFDRKTVIVPTVAMAVELTGVKQATVSQQCSRKSVTPYNGWLFRYETDFEGWPQFTEKHLEFFKGRVNVKSDAIIVEDAITNEEVYFGDKFEASKQVGISPIRVGALARQGAVRQGLRYRQLTIQKKSPQSVTTE